MGFQARKRTYEQKTNIMGEFKKLVKSSRRMQENAQKVDSKIKEKKEDKQMASAPQPQPQPQYQYQYQEQPQPQPQPQPQYQQSTQSNQQRTGQGPSGPTFTASSSNSSSYRSTPPPPRQDFGSNLKRFQSNFGIPTTHARADGRTEPKKGSRKKCNAKTIHPNAFLNICLN